MEVHGVAKVVVARLGAPGCLHSCFYTPGVSVNRELQGSFKGLLGFCKVGLELILIRTMWLFP